MFPIVENLSSKNGKLREALSESKSIILATPNHSSYLVEVERLEKDMNNINYDIVELSRILIDHPDMVVEDKILNLQDAICSLEEGIIALYWSLAQ